LIPHETKGIFTPPQPVLAQNAAGVFLSHTSHETQTYAFFYAVRIAFCCFIHGIVGNGVSKKGDNTAI